MPLYTRETLPVLLGDPAKQTAQVYLVFGERYLCQHASTQLASALLNEGGIAHPIDGDQEDGQATLAKLRSFSLLPGRQLYKVTDSRLFHSKLVAKTLWERAFKAHSEGKQEQAGRVLRSLLDAGGLNPNQAETELETMSSEEWQHLFGFAKPGGDLSWTKQYLRSENTPDHNRGRQGTTDPAEALLAALASGIPRTNILMLLAEDVDKRKKLFKILKDEQIVIDLSVDTGAGAKAQKEQKSVLLDLVKQTLAEQQKTMTPGLVDILLERVGFHPVALVMELRKVMLFLGERRQITRQDLDELVGRTRQEALFELTSAITERNLGQIMTVSTRLHDNGVHPLAVIATLRNFVRGLLLCRTLQAVPGLHYSPTMSAATFQQQCLPLLKEREPWAKEMSGHPYALYMQFKTAAGYSLAQLCRWMKLLLTAEMRIKGSSVEPEIIVQHLLLAMFPPSSP